MASDYEEAERRITEVKASGSTTLSLQGLMIEELPASLKELEYLLHLDIRDCPHLINIGEVANLRGLLRIQCGISYRYLFGECPLEDIEALCDLPELQQLELTGCARVTNFDGLRRLTGLRRFNLSCCDNLIDLR